MVTSEQPNYVRRLWLLNQKLIKTPQSIPLLTLPSSRLELNGHRRRLTWEATPRSIHEGVSSAIMNSDCLVFDTSIAQLFADNGNLGINVTISMC